MADRSELLFELVGQVGRQLQRTVDHWDGFAVLARFDAPTPTLTTWYYLAGDPGARQADSTPEAASTFGQLRVTVEVPAEPVHVGVLTYARDSGVTDLQMLAAAAEVDQFAQSTPMQIGQRLRPRQIP